MKKKLLSKFHDTGWTSFAGKTYPVVCLPVDKLWQSVPIVEKMHGKPFRETLMNDIKNDGLYHPLMCVECSKLEVFKAKKRYKNQLTPLPFKPDKKIFHEKMFVIWGGSQRLSVAKELGYTHIDCTMIPTLQLAKSLQKEMRHLFKPRYYTRQPISEKNRIIP